MGSCNYIKENGARCGSTFGINILYYRDAHSMWIGEKEVCQTDSQKVFGKLMIEEENIKLRLEKLYALRSKVYNKDKEHDEQIIELEREVIRALQDQHKLESVNSPIERKRQVQNAMISEVYRRIKKIGEVLRTHRNKVCRLCIHDLECTCVQCRHPENPRHWGDTISSVTVFSQKLYRRNTFNFHVLCGRIFIGMFGVNLLPTKAKQQTLLQAMGL